MTKQLDIYFLYLPVADRFVERLARLHEDDEVFARAGVVKVAKLSFVGLIDQPSQKLDAERRSSPVLPFIADHVPTFPLLEEARHARPPVRLDSERSSAGWQAQKTPPIA
jgi:hypothetical protein